MSEIDKVFFMNYYKYFLMFWSKQNFTKGQEKKFLNLVRWAWGSGLCVQDFPYKEIKRKEEEFCQTIDFSQADNPVSYDTKKWELDEKFMSAAVSKEEKTSLHNMSTAKGRKEIASLAHENRRIE